MRKQVFERGLFTVTSVCARCDACHQVRPAAQLTGPHGCVTLCVACLVDIGVTPDLKIEIRRPDG